MHVHGPRHVTQAIRDLLGNRVVRVQVPADNLNVDRGRQTEVQNLTHDVGRLKEEFRSGKIKRQIFAQLLDILLGRMMMLLIQRDQYLGIGRSNGSAGAVGSIDGAEGQTDVVQNRDQLVLRNLLAQRLLDFIAKTSCFFDARSRARAQMQTEDSSVDAGEEILAEKEDQSE